jgi:hypothetical protein
MTILKELLIVIFSPLVVIYGLIRYIIAFIKGGIKATEEKD